MKFIGFWIVLMINIPHLYSQCSSSNPVIINDLTFETPTDASINVLNSTGETFQLQQKIEGGVFKDIGVSVKNLGKYFFKTTQADGSCFRLASSALGCLPSNTACLPSWRLYSIPEMNVIDFSPPSNDEILILKNNVENYKYVNVKTPSTYTDNKIVCRKDDVYRIVVISGSTTINTYKWTIRALAGSCAVEAVVAPNIFTPNLDGHNDSFELKGKKDDFYSIIIFDRWSNTVFETPNFDIQWNGNINNGGEPAPEGLYYFILKKLDKNAEIISEKGEILLAR